jgi:hypothetical protein
MSLGRLRFVPESLSPRSETLTRTIFCGSFQSDAKSEYHHQQRAHDREADRSSRERGVPKDNDEPDQQSAKPGNTRTDVCHVVRPTRRIRQKHQRCTEKQPSLPGWALNHDPKCQEDGQRNGEYDTDRQRRPGPHNDAGDRETVAVRQELLCTSEGLDRPADRHPWYR